MPQAAAEMEVTMEQGVTVLSLFLLLEFFPSLNSKGWCSSRSRMLRATIVSVFTVCIILLRLRLNVTCLTSLVSSQPSQVTTPWFPPEENPASLEKSAQVNNQEIRGMTMRKSVG